MNRGFFIFLGIVILISSPFSISSNNTPSLNSAPMLEQISKGVVLIDDNHDNDYSVGELDEIVKDLLSLGFLPFFTSEFGGWENALEYAHYMIITTPKTAFSTSELDILKAWFENGTRNLLLSSRGDFGEFANTAEKVNSLMSTLDSSIRTQDDNVYTTDPLASSLWRVASSNLQNTVPELITDVTEINFFSPSSVRTINASAEIILYGDPDEYQTDQNEPAPEIIFDNSDDGSGGDSIPLIAYEELTLGSTSDRIIVTGTTLWSDFNYNSNPENIQFFRNVMEYFHTRLTEIDGSISIDIPDLAPPNIFIKSPRDNSVVKGTMMIEADVTDIFGIESIEIYVDDILKATEDTFSWDTTLETEGEHKVKVIAKDVNENVASRIHTVIVNQSYIPQLDYTVKVMTYNIKEGGLDPEWINVMKEENPDIIVIVEANGWSDDNQKILKDNLATLNSYFDDEIAYTGVVDVTTGVSAGTAIISRFPIISSNEIKSVRLDSGSSFIPTHDFLHADIQIGNHRVAVIGTHLKCCSISDNPLNEDKREKSQEGIINYMDDLGNVPIIYAGDMNSEHPDESQSDLGNEPVSMLLNPNNPRASKIHTFTDVHKELRPDDLVYTHELGARIDFIFVNQFFDNLLISSTTGDTPSAIGASDHLSVDVIMDLSSFLDEIESDDGNDGFLYADYELGILAIVLIPVITRRRFLKIKK